jgi:hypothetical protein
MATVTGEFQVDFAGLSDTNPYTNANFDALTGTARIASGLWRTIDPGTLAQWHLDPGAYTFGNVIRAKVELGNATGFDGLWANVIDASGNGYGVRMSGGDTLTRLRWDAFAGAEILTEPMTAADGDQMEIEYTKSTGAVRVYYNSTLISALNLTDSTHAAATLQAGLSQRPNDAGQGGIRSFAADGLASAGSIAAIRRYFSMMRAGNG